MQNMPKSVNSENACGAEEETRGKNGLILKYDVKKIETGEPVENCFVLRPDRDPAAVAALRAYARATPNKALASDILGWVGAGGSLLAEVLGVEEDEPWVYPGIKRPLRIHNGVRQAQFPDGRWGDIDDEVELTIIVNHPESIIRVPRLTEPEIAILRSLGATRAMWRAATSYVILFKTEQNDPVAYVDHGLFPSLKQQGEEIELEETE